MASPSSTRDARAEIPGLRGVVFLNWGSQGLVSRPVLESVRAHVDRLERGPGGDTWATYLESLEEPFVDARREGAALLGVSVEEVALVTDTTTGLQAAMEAIPFRPGENVVFADLEYPQVGLAARGAVRCDGAELRVVRHDQGRLSTDAYRAAIDDRTRAILVSSVGWVTGERIDLVALSELAKRHDAFLVVDAIQELGVRDLDMSALGIDFLAAGAYKWLGSPFGLGLAYVSAAAHERDLRTPRVGLQGCAPPEGGWGEFYGSPETVALPSLEPAAAANRFEAPGTPSAIGARGLAAAIRFRRAVIDGERHLLDLAGALRRGVTARGARVWTPEPEAERAGIVSFTLGHGPARDEALRRHLEAAGVFVSARWCAGVGGLRASVHAYNEESDIDRFLAEVDRFETS